MIKKIVTVVLVSCLILSTFGCDSRQEDKNKNPGTEASGIDSINTKPLDPSLKGEDSTSNQPSVAGPKETNESQGPGVLTKKQLVGVSRVPLMSVDDWGIKVSAKNITPTRATLVFEQQGGKQKGDLLTGAYYSLEKKENDVWQTVTPIIPEDQMAYQDIGLPVNTDQTTEFNVDWTSFYGSLGPGKYRIGKSVLDSRKPGDFTEKSYYAAFDLIEADESTQIHYEHDGFGLSLPYVPGFEYSIEEFTTDLLGLEKSFAISFRPINEQGKISFTYFTNFGVCGTELKVEDYRDGEMGTYDQHPFWDFIAFPASQGYFVALNQSSGEWFSVYEDQIMQVIDGALRIDPEK